VSIAAVALANGLNANVLRRWILLDQRATAGGVKPTGALLPVVLGDLPKRTATVKPVADEMAAIEIDVNGARIRLSSQATAEQIGAVVSALRA
jgi:hypothetical protein